MILELVTRGFELVTHGFDIHILTNGFIAKLSMDYHKV